MVDWTEPMQQTFEYYIVNPATWQDESRLTVVKQSTINRDAETDTLGSATFDVVDQVGECYIRIYMVTIQNGVREKHPLGTFLVQTPTSTFDGKTRNVSMDGYTPLIELKENQPDIGYYVPKTAYYEVEYDSEKNEYRETTKKMESPIGKPLDNVKTTSGKTVYSYTNSKYETVYYCAPESITANVYRLLLDKVRAPIVRNDMDEAVLASDFVSDVNDTWYSYLRDLLSMVKLSFDLDEMSRIIFVPHRDLASMQPVWTYTDDNSSILLPEVTMDHDIYGIPNVIEVRYFDGYGNHYCRIENKDPHSPTSTVNRGRSIVYRVTDLEVPGTLGMPPETETVDDSRPDMSIRSKADKFVVDYAIQLLRDLSTIEYTITYTHGYCPVRLGDCVRLNYSRAGLTNIKAKVISQSIKCEPGCSVTEKAIYTSKLWG